MEVVHMKRKGHILMCQFESASWSQDVLEYQDRTVRAW